MGWLTCMANGSKQDLRGSYPFLEGFAIHHLYQAFKMMVIHLVFW